MTIDAALALFEAELAAKSPRTLKTYRAAFRCLPHSSWPPAGCPPPRRT